MKRKIEAGASFFQTQAVFEISKLEPLARMARDMNIPLLMGVLGLRTPDVARFVKEQITGIHVPERLIAELTRAKDPVKAGIEIAARLIHEAKEVCDGVHIMNAGQEGLLQQILDEAGVR